MRAVTTVWIITLWGFGIVIVIYALWALNWAPLWMRLYSECMNQVPEANTVSESFQHRARCAHFATRVVKKQP
jgi:hypothetical protein